MPTSNWLTDNRHSLTLSLFFIQREEYSSLGVEECLNEVNRPTTKAKSIADYQQNAEKITDQRQINTNRQPAQSKIIDIWIQENRSKQPHYGYFFEGRFQKLICLGLHWNCFAFLFQKLLQFSFKFNCHNFHCEKAKVLLINVANRLSF